MSKVTCDRQAQMRNTIRRQVSIVTAVGLFLTTACLATQTQSPIGSVPASPAASPSVSLAAPSAAADQCRPEDTVDISAIATGGPAFAFERLDLDLEQAVYVSGHPTRSDLIYVAERAGRILAIESETLRPDPVVDLTGQVSTVIEDGFMSFAIHPAGNRLFALYNAENGDVVLTEYSLTSDGLEASLAREVLVIDKPDGVHWHSGGQAQFGPDGLLYVGMGDAARNPLDPLPDPHPDIADPDHNAQNEAILFGKLLRLDVGLAEPAPEIVAVGLRNPWRFSFDRQTGDLYIGDVGQHRWEEIDVLATPIEPLLNLGWSVCEGVEEFKDEPIPGPGTVIGPVAVYRHGTFAYCGAAGSVTGGYVYRGSSISDLVGMYLFGDFCSGTIWTLYVDAGRVVTAARAEATLRGVVSFGEDADGELYAVSMNSGLYRVVPD